MANYKHRVVQGLADLLNKYGGGGSDPIMRAVWFGMKQQIPLLLKSLDENEEAIASIERTLKEVLEQEPNVKAVEVVIEEPPPIEEVKEAIEELTYGREHPEEALTITEVPQVSAPQRRRQRTKEEKMENVGQIETVEE